MAEKIIPLVSLFLFNVIVYSLMNVALYGNEYTAVAMILGSRKLTWRKKKMKME